VMHKDVLSRIVKDEPVSFFIVEPFNFAAGHKLILPCLSRPFRGETPAIDPIVLMVVDERGECESNF
jgi:hypothetical protein